MTRSADLLAVGLLVVLATACAPSFASSCLPVEGGYDLTGEKVRFHYRDRSAPGKNVDRIVAEADNASFAVLEHPFRNVGTCGRLALDYARDKRHVYYQGRVIEGADPGTFTFFHRSYARDKHGVYGPSRRISERTAEFGAIRGGTYATDGERHFH